MLAALKAGYTSRIRRIPSGEAVTFQFQSQSQFPSHPARFHIAGTEIRAQRVVLTAGADVADILMLQGKPIGEPVARHGPFVMNSRSEILQAFQDYQRTEFGGWPWPSDGPVHSPEEGRHARHPDGRIERPD